MTGDTPWRNDTLGASDAAAVVGVDPFRGPGDVWAEKTGRLPADDADRDAGDAAALGQAIAPVLLATVERRLRVSLARELFYRHPDAPLAATIDGIALDAGVLVEAKTCGLLGPSPLLAAYGDDGTDQVPDSVLIQVQHQLAVLDAQPDVPPIRTIVVPALLGGRGLRVYRLVRDQALVDELVALETDWWQRHVVADSYPRDDLPSLPTLRALRRRADLPAVPLDPPTVAAWLQAKEELKAATAAEEVARRHVLAALGDAERGVCAAGRLSYFAHERAAYTVAAQKVRTLRFTAARDQEDSR
jgi:predicted phage-related endonuclease